MEGAAVGLYHQAQLRPVEIDLESVDVDARERPRKTGLQREPDEGALKPGAREGEDAAVDRALHLREARARRHVLEGISQGIDLDHVEQVRLVDQVLDLGGREACREVHDRGRGGGDRDAAVGGDLECVAAVELYASVAAGDVSGHGDVNRPACLLPHPPQRGCVVVAERGVRAAGHHRRHPPALGSQVTPADRVDPSKRAMEPCRPAPVVDRVSTEPEPDQLGVRDHPVLACRESCSTRPLKT